jgi:hypothetical protein
VNPNLDWSVRGIKVGVMFRVIPQGQQAWLGVLFRMLIFLAVLFQIAFFFVPDLHPDLAHYRFAERRQALSNYARKQTPQTLAAWKEEMRLLNAHRGNQALLVLIAFLTVDGVAVYFLWNYGDRKRLP